MDTLIFPLVLKLALTQVASAATIEVTTTADTIDNQGNCSLREAVLSANFNVGVDGCTAGEPLATAVDTIHVPAGTYTLSRAGLDESWTVGTGVEPYDVVDDPDAIFGDLDLLESVIVAGDGSASTVIQWASQQDRLFQVAAVGADDVLAEFVGLTLTGGHVAVEVINPSDPPADQWALRRLGGAVAVGPGAALKLLSSSGSDEDSGPPDVHEAAGEPSIVMHDVVIGQNSSEGDAGGLFAGGDFTGSDLKFLSNTCDGNGGGLYADGVVDLQRVTLYDNTAEGGGGGFFTGTTNGTMTQSLIRANHATGGGGISARSLVTLQLVNTVIVENDAFDVGGGLYTNGLFQLSASSVVGNLSGSDAGFASGGLTAFGQGSFQIERTIISGNLAATNLVNCGCTGSGCDPAGYFQSGGYNPGGRGHLRARPDHRPGRHRPDAASAR